MLADDLPPDQRRRLSEGLDAAESTLIGIMKRLLAVIAAAALVGLGYVILRMPEGGGSQGEWFYAAAFLVLVLFVVWGQYTKVQRRLARRHDGHPVAQGMKALRKSFNVSLGSAEPPLPMPPSSRLQPGTFNISFRSTEPQVFRLDQAQIDRARDQLQHGRDLDDVMAEVVPEYARLNVLEKRLYRSAFEAALKAEP